MSDVVGTQIVGFLTHRLIFLIFLIFAQNIDCGYTLELPWRGGSNEYPQFMFWSKNKKNWFTPAYPSFCYIKVGFKGVCQGHVSKYVDLCSSSP